MLDDGRMHLRGQHDLGITDQFRERVTQCGGHCTWVTQGDAGIDSINEFGPAGKIHRQRFDAGRQGIHRGRVYCVAAAVGDFP